MAERFISVKQVLDRVCLCKTELYDRIKAGTFPRSVALGPHKVVFLESQVDAWMQAQVAGADSGIGARRKRAHNAVAARRDRQVPA
jgi:prophage regulatory protein